MKKRIFWFAFLILIFIISIPSVALAATEGDYDYTDNGDGTCTITSYLKYTVSNITIPDTINGLSVTKIGPYAFKAKGLTGVTIPDSVVEIGNYAFDDNDLVSVILSQNIEKIGNSAFAFNEIESINLPSTLSTIGEMAFDWNKLKTLVIPDSVTTLGACAFSHNLLELVTISENISILKYFTFADNNLKSVTIPENVTKIEYQVFISNETLQSVIFHPTSKITEIGNYAFYTCGLTEITLPNTLEKIGWNAFDNNSLTSVTIPESVISIGSSAFSGNSITSISLPCAPAPIGYEYYWTGYNSGKVKEITNLGDSYTKDTDKTPIPYPITYNLDGSTNHSSNPTTYTIEDSTITLQAPTKEGYDFTGWTPTNTISEGSMGKKTFTANWKIKTYNVNITAEAHGSVSPIGTQVIEHGNELCLTVTPDIGYHVSSYDKGTSSCLVNDNGDGTYTIKSIREDTNITFRFSVNFYLLTMIASPNGTIQYDKINVAHGTDYIIRPTPDYGYHAEVTSRGSHTILDNGNGTFTVQNITSPDTIDVNFVKNTYTINFICGANGSITPTSATATHDDSVDCTPIPNPWYQVTSISTSGNAYTSWNPDGSITLMNIRSNCTIYVGFSKIPATGIQFVGDTSSMDLGVTMLLGTQFYHDILPLGCLDTDVTWQSSNPDIASINSVSGTITANKQGITSIKVSLLYRPWIYDEILLTVGDPSIPIPPKTHCGNITGKLIDSSGNPLAGYPITLCSDPQTAITGIDGSFLFENVPLIGHELIVNNETYSELGRFSMNFLEGATNSSTIDNALKTIDVAFTSRTLSIDVTLQTNPMLTDFSAAAIGYEVKPPDAKVENPETGYEDFAAKNNMLALAIILLLCLSLTIKLVVAKSRYKVR